MSRRQTRAEPGPRDEHQLRRPVAPLTSPPLVRARDYLHEHFAEPVSLAELAAVAGLSRFHLVRRFRAVYGVSPHAYLTHLRIVEACKALRGGARPAEIEVGFADQSHLGRHFKRLRGTSPAAWAAKQRQLSP